MSPPPLEALAFLRGQDLRRSALLQLLLRPVRLSARGDNTTCLSAVRSGFSKKMAYMAKTQRVAVGFLNEVYYGDVSAELGGENDSMCINRLRYEPSVSNVADLLTKPLAADKTRYLIEKLGMKSVAAVVASFVR